MKSSVLSILVLGTVINAENRVRVDWHNVMAEPQLSLSHQTVVNPLILPNSSIYENAMNSLELIANDYARFVPWYPYTVLAVTELEPPVKNDTSCSTSWDFSWSDVLLGDFFKYTKGKSRIINYSTTPDWLWNTTDWSYPNDVNAINRGYNRGTALNDPSGKEVGDYYERFFGWYTQGGFVDECNRYHHSGHHWNIDFWEVLNEPNSEHRISPELYNIIYDAVVEGVRQVSPDTRFIGLSLTGPNGDIDDANIREPYLDYFRTFLDKSKHKENIPIDLFGFHWYTSSNNSISAFESADTYFRWFNLVNDIRKELSPEAKFSLDEVGTMWSDLSVSDALPAEYWVWSGGVFAYYFGFFSRHEEVVSLGQSQLVAYPGQYPSVSMVDWNTGLPNARLRVLQLLLHNFNKGFKVVNTGTGNSDQYFAQGYITEDGRKKFLLINKQETTVDIDLEGFSGGIAQIVDTTTNGNEWRQEDVPSTKFSIPGYATVVITQN